MASQRPQDHAIQFTRLPWILSPQYPFSPALPFIMLGGFFGCYVPWNFLRDHCFLVARIHAWVLLEEHNTGDFLLLNPPNAELMLLPRPHLAPRRVTCTAILSMSPDDHDFWLFLSEGNRIFACRPRRGSYWFLRSLYCDIISMASATTTTTTGAGLFCLMKDLRVARFDLSADRVTILTMSPAANSVPPLCRAVEHFLILNEGQILVAIVGYRFWSSPFVDGFGLYIVRDRSWEVVGRDVVRNRVLFLVSGGHSFSFRAPSGQGGGLAHLVLSSEIFRGFAREWGRVPMWIVLDLERSLVFGYYN